MRDEVKKMEEIGIDVVVMDKGGHLVYATNAKDGKEYCDNCKYLSFLPDPDPNDWFRDDDQKAVCNCANKVIRRYLEFNELTGISRPDFCPLK